MTLQDFATAHDTEVLTEWSEHTEKFYARMRGVKVRILGGFLRSEFGRGKTPTEARNDYAERIAAKPLAISRNGTRVDVDAPYTFEREDAPEHPHTAALRAIANGDNDPVGIAQRALHTDTPTKP